MIRVRIGLLVLLMVLLSMFAGACTSTSENTSPTTTPAPTAVFPAADWLRADPIAVGLEPSRLDEVEQFLGDQQSTCMTVVKDGHLVREAYWNGATPDDDREVFSVTKSITSTLVGIAQAEGLLGLDDPASRFVTEWQGTRART